MSAPQSAIVADDGRITWIPLESDPDIMTEYLRMLTLTDHYLLDVPVIDGAEEMGLFTGHNVKAFLFLYQINERTEAEDVKPSEASEVAARLYHMKQTIRNACGSVALFHAYLNTVDASKFEPSSVMAKFYAKTAELDAEKRCEVFSSSEEISQLHHQAARQGQSTVPAGEALKNINYHYVAIIPKEGTVFRMDGRISKPAKMGECTEGGFIQAGLAAIKTLIARDPDNLSFNILAFCGN